MNREKLFRAINRFASAAAIIALVLAFALPLDAAEVHADDNTMLTLNYDVTVDVAENNSYDIAEHLDMYYVTPHHGIYRYLPTQGQKISGVKVPGYDYETYRQSGYEVIKIGSGSRTLQGEHPYDIIYNIAMYDDENSDVSIVFAGNFVVF